MKLLKKILWGLLALMGIAVVTYLIGPRMKFEKYDNTPLQGLYSLEEVEDRINDRNSNSLIKRNNHEEIVWFDGKKKTEFTVIYMHGFSASQEEGAPMHRNIANRYGANLMLTRLPKHGLSDEDAFAELSPALLVNYAKEAIKIGKSIGEKVILMSCSTGGTLSTYLAASDPDIFSLLMFSPNFEMHSQSTKILTKPWGLQLGRMVKGSNYHEWNTPQVARPYWYHKYRLEGVIALQSLIDKTMNDETFSKIKQPVFVGYFYKDEMTRDFTVSTDRIKDFEKSVSSPKGMKSFKTYPDGKAHVFISPFFNDNWSKVQEDVYEFLEEKLEMKPVFRQVLVESD